MDSNVTVLPADPVVGPNDYPLGQSEESSADQETVGEGGVLTSRRRAAAAVAAAWVMTVSLRLVLSASRTGPLVVADEIGYLAHARVLAGGVPIDLSTATYYYSGSSLFMVPAFWFTDDPETCYQVVLVLQAVISACVLPLLYGLCRELGITREVSLGAALIASVSVDAVIWSTYALSESLLASLIVAWVWLTVRMVRLGDSRAGRVSAALLGLTFGLLASSHSRGLVLVVIGTIAAFASIRWASWRTLLVCAGTGAVAVAAALWLNVETMRVNYPGRSASGLIPNSGGSGADLALSDQLVTAFGQVWYAAAATGLLALYGLMYAWYLAFSGGSELKAPRLTAAALLTFGSGAVAFGSARVLLASVGRPSPDYLVYGRYISAFLPLAIAFGVIGLATRATRTVWALRGATALSAVILYGVVHGAAEQIDPNVAPRAFPIPGVSVISHLVSGDTDHLYEARVTALALTFFVVVCALSAARGRFANAALVVAPTLAFAGLAVAAASTIAMSSDRRSYPEGAMRDAGHVDDVRTIAWDGAIGSGGVANIVTRMRFAYFAEDAVLSPFDSDIENPPGHVDLVAATQRWDGEVKGFTEIARLPEMDIVVWEALP